MPVIRTNQIPVRTFRSGMGGRPLLGRGLGGGRRGSITAHSSEDGGKKLLNRARGMDARFDPRKKIQSPLYRLKQFILRLSEHWSRYRLWLFQPEVPPHE